MYNFSALVLIDVASESTIRNPHDIARRILERGADPREVRKFLQQWGEWFDDGVLILTDQREEEILTELFWLN